MSDYDTAVYAAAQRVLRRYRAYVSADDLTQEARAWILSHPNKVADYYRDVEEGDYRAHNVAAKRFTRQLERVMEKVAREAKAAKSGYRPDDEFFYSMGLLESVLPVLYNPELAATPPVRERDEISANVDPAEAGNWLAHVIDVKRAFAVIEPSLQEQTAVYLRYGVGLSEEKAAHVMSMARHPYHDLLTGVMRRLAWQLNGLVPDRGEPDLVPAD